MSVCEPNSCHLWEVSIFCLNSGGGKEIFKLENCRHLKARKLRNAVRDLFACEQLLEKQTTIGFLNDCGRKMGRYNSVKSDHKDSWARFSG